MTAERIARLLASIPAPWSEGTRAERVAEFNEKVDALASRCDYESDAYKSLAIRAMRLLLVDVLEDLQDAALPLEVDVPIAEGYL